MCCWWWCRKTGVSELVSLGGFRNIRKDFDWEGAKLELDETQFEWGTVYEIEVETVSLLQRPKSDHWGRPHMPWTVYICPLPSLKHQA